MFLLGCTKNLPKDTIVYQNSFDNGKGDLTIYKPDGIDTNQFALRFNGRDILGPFNHRTAYLYLSKLPPHSLLQFSFDLYIHDKWAGYGINPPDYWGIFIDKERDFYTTFSNTANAPQSYPEHEGFMFPPGANAIEKLPGLNALKNDANGTNVYKIVMTKVHNKDYLDFALSDLIADGNVLNKSWSIDNLKIVCTNIEK